MQNADSARSAGDDFNARDEADPAGAGALTIFAVDDDPLVLTSAAAMIEELGHTVVEAHSGAQALSILRGGTRVDMVITDQSMPEITGVQSRNRYKMLARRAGRAGDRLQRPAARLAAVSDDRQAFHGQDLARKIEELLAPR